LTFIITAPELGDGLALSLALAALVLVPVRAPVPGPVPGPGILLAVLARVVVEPVMLDEPRQAAARDERKADNSAGQVVVMQVAIAVIVAGSSQTHLNKSGEPAVQEDPGGNVQAETQDDGGAMPVGVAEVVVVEEVP